MGGKQTWPYFCSLCGRRFKHWWQKAAHMKSKHNIGK